MDDLQAAISLAASEGLRVGGEAILHLSQLTALPIGTSLIKKENWDNERPILIH